MPVTTSRSERATRSSRSCSRLTVPVSPRFALGACRRWNTWRGACRLARRRPRVRFHRTLLYSRMMISGTRLEAIVNTAAAHPEIRALYLFGSQASGSARPDSDFDLGVLYRNTQPLSSVLAFE